MSNKNICSDCTLTPAPAPIGDGNNGLQECPMCKNVDAPLQSCDHCGHHWYITGRVEARTPAPFQTCDNCRMNTHRLGMPCLLCGDPPDYTKWQFENSAPKVTDSPMTLDGVIEGLEYILNSPPQEHGGFHPQTIRIAKSALAFIRTLAQRAGEERYSIPEIIAWFETKVWIGVNNKGVFCEFINAPNTGIKAVTTRANTRPDRGMEDK